MTIDDERFEALLRQVGQEYNSPPPTPKDAMWDRIATERRQRQTAVPIRRRRWLWSAAAAAMLLIGIAIGRWALPGGRSAGKPRVASTAERPEGVLASDREWGARDLRPDRSAYQLAALEHLTQAEALIVSFRAESKGGELNADVQAWSRDLLTTTRLLIDSPAAEDRAMRKLLEDLELVLAQISQLRGTRRPGELELIDQAVEQREVLTRLRRAVPSTSSRSGS